MGDTFASPVRFGQAEALGAPHERSGHFSRAGLVVRGGSSSRVVSGAILRAAKVSAPLTVCIAFNDLLQAIDGQTAGVRCGFDLVHTRVL